jgi:hypothetical protein
MTWRSEQQHRTLYRSHNAEASSSQSFKNDATTFLKEFSTMPVRSKDGEIYVNAICFIDCCDKIYNSNYSREIKIDFSKHTIKLFEKIITDHLLAKITRWHFQEFNQLEEDFPAAFFRNLMDLLHFAVFLESGIGFDAIGRTLYEWRRKIDNDTHEELKSSLNAFIQSYEDRQKSFEIEKFFETIRQYIGLKQNREVRLKIKGEYRSLNINDVEIEYYSLGAPVYKIYYDTDQVAIVQYHHNEKRRLDNGEKRQVWKISLVRLPENFIRIQEAETFMSEIHKLYTERAAPSAIKTTLKHIEWLFNRVKGFSNPSFVPKEDILNLDESTYGFRPTTIVQVWKNLKKNIYLNDKELADDLQVVVRTCVRATEVVGNLTDPVRGGLLSFARHINRHLREELNTAPDIQISQ